LLQAFYNIVTSSEGTHYYLWWNVST